MKRDWKDFTNGLDADFELLHRMNKVRDSLILLLGTPVVGEESGEMRMLVDAESLKDAISRLARSRVP